MQQELDRPQNDRALEAWLKRKTAGMGLSDRVWNLTSQTKAQIEHSIEVALAKGTPAQKLSQEVRSCLQNPDNFFRRFQYKAGEQPLYDEHGKPMLDSSGKQMTKPIYGKKWKMRYVDDEGNYRWRDVDLNDYRYGRGVYRSSYKNAMRLARTEVNMAYHASDTERWSSAWYVKGIRISLSNNHTTLDPDGKRIPLHDICDDLAGDYPPDFDFKGWHPQCRCFAHAITATREEIKEYYRRKRAGEDMTGYRLPGTITEPPAAFKQWLSDNQDRLARAAARGTTPYFVKDNLSYIGDTPVPASPAPQTEMPDPTPPTSTTTEQSPQKSIAELAAERHAARTPEDIARIQSEWNQRNIQRAAEVPQMTNEKFKTQTFRSGGILQTPTVGSQTTQEKTKNENLATHMARYHGMRLRLLPINPKAPRGVPQPDCLNLDSGNKIEFKICEPKTDNAKSSIQNAIKEGSRQGCKEIIVEFNKPISSLSVYQGLMAALQPGRASGVKELIIKYHDLRIKRIDIEVWRERIDAIRKKRAK